MQRYARHRRFIFSISAIYLEAAHKQNPSYPGQPLHHTRNTSVRFCFICRLSRGTDLIWLYFYSLQFIVEHSAFLGLARKSDWMNLGTPLHNVHNPALNRRHGAAALDTALCGERRKAWHMAQGRSRHGMDIVL